MLSLKSACENVDAIQDEMARLLPALIMLNKIFDARSLQAQFGTLLTMCQTGAQRVWPEILRRQDLPGPLYELVGFLRQEACLADQRILVSLR